MEELAIKKSITIDAATSKVWYALTDPEMIKKYLFGTNTISDWKVGSPIIFTGEWEGKTYEDKGTILKLEKEKVFQYTYWSSFSGKPDVPENYLIVTFELQEKNGKTILNLKNENFKDKSELEHSSSNWDNVLKGIKKVTEEYGKK